MGGRADDLLKVIQQEEELPVAEVVQQAGFLGLGSGGFHAQRLRNGRNDQVSFGDGGQ